MKQRIPPNANYNPALTQPNLQQPSRNQQRQDSCSSALYNRTNQSIKKTVSYSNASQYSTQNKKEKNINVQKFQKQDNVVQKDNVNVVMKENEMLKEEIKLLHSLLQDAFPVFTQATEEVNEHKLNSKTQGRNNKEPLSQLQKSISLIKQVIDQDYLNQPSEMIEYDDFEPSILDEQTAIHRKGITSLNLSGTSNSNFASNKENGKSPLSRRMPFLPMHNIDKRGKLKDLNRASKNFNLPMVIDIEGQKDKQNDQKQDQQRNLNVESLKQLKNIICKINQAPTVVSQLQKQQIQSINQTLALSKINNYATTFNNYENEQLLSQQSRNYSVNCNQQQYFSENFNAGSMNSEDGFVSNSIGNKLLQINNPPILSQADVKCSPFERYQPLSNNLINQFQEAKQIRLLQGPPNRKEMVYPSPLIMDLSSNQIECMPSFMTSPSVNSNSSSQKSHHSFTSLKSNQNKNITQIQSPDKKSNKSTDRKQHSNNVLLMQNNSEESLDITNQNLYQKNNYQLRCNEEVKCYGDSQNDGNVSEVELLVYEDTQIDTFKEQSFAIVTKKISMNVKALTQEIEEDFQQYSDQIKQANQDQDTFQQVNDQTINISQVIDFYQQNNQAPLQLSKETGNFFLQNSNLSSMTGGTIFQESYDPAKSQRCAEDLPKQNEYNPVLVETSFTQLMTKNIYLNQDDQMLSKIILNEETNRNSLHFKKKDKENLIIATEMNQQSAYLHKKHQQIVNYQKGQETDYLNDKNNAMEESRLDEDSVPRFQILDVVQEQMPMFQNIPDSSRNEQLILNKSSLSDAKHISSSSKQSKCPAKTKKRNKSLSNYDMPRKNINTKWCTEAQKESELVHLNKQAILQTKNLVSSCKNIHSRKMILTDKISQKTDPLLEDINEQSSTVSLGIRSSSIDEDNIISVLDVQYLDNQTPSIVQLFPSQQISQNEDDQIINIKDMIDQSKRQSKQQQDEQFKRKTAFVMEEREVNEIKVIDVLHTPKNQVNKNMIGSGQTNRYQTMAQGITKEFTHKNVFNHKDKIINQILNQKVHEEIKHQLITSEDLLLQLSDDDLQKQVVDSCGNFYILTKIDSEQTIQDNEDNLYSNSTEKRALLEDMLDEFIKENILIKNYEDNEKEMNDDSSLVHQSESDDQLQTDQYNYKNNDQLEQQSIDSEFQGQTLVVELRISPLKLSFQQFDSTIREEPSQEEQESRISLHKPKQNKQDSSFITVNSQISLTNIDIRPCEMFNTTPLVQANKTKQQYQTPTIQLQLKKAQVSYAKGSHRSKKQSCVEPINVQEDNLYQSSTACNRYRTPIRAQQSLEKQINSTTLNESTPINQQNIYKTTLDLDCDSTTEAEQKRDDNQVQFDCVKDLTGCLSKIKNSLTMSFSSRESTSKNQFNNNISNLKQNENFVFDRALLVKEKREQQEKEKTERLQFKLDKKLDKIEKIRELENAQLVQINQQQHAKSALQTSRDIQTEKQEEQKQVITSLKATAPQPKQMSLSRTRQNSAQKSNPMVRQQFYFNQVLKKVQMKKDLLEEEKHQEFEMKLKQKEERIRMLLQKKRDQEDKILQIRQKKEHQLSLTNNNNSINNICEINLVNSNKQTPRKVTSATRGIGKSSFVAQSDGFCKTSRREDESSQNKQNLKLSYNAEINCLSGEKSQPKTMFGRIGLCNKREQTLGAQTERTIQYIGKELFSPIKSNLQPTHREQEFMKKIEKECHSRRKVKENKVSFQQKREDLNFQL